jgi:hypothetical protein
MNRTLRARCLLQPGVLVVKRHHVLRTAVPRLATSNTVARPMPEVGPVMIYALRSDGLFMEIWLGISTLLRCLSSQSSDVTGNSSFAGSLLIDARMPLWTTQRGDRPSLRWCSISRAPFVCRRIRPRIESPSHQRSICPSLVPHRRRQATRGVGRMLPGYGYC